MPLLDVNGDPGSWDALVASSPQGHLLQSYSWGELKARHGWSVSRFAYQDGDGLATAQVLWRSTPLGRIGYLPRGPALSPAGNEAAACELLQAVHAEAARRGALLLKAEPNAPDAGLLPALGFRPSRQTVQPRVTIIVDLEQPLETLLARQHSKTRYNVHLAARRGVRVRRGGPDDIAVFARLMQETSERDAFAARPASYYRDALALLGDAADLLLAEHEGEVLAAILVAKFNGVATYLFGASSSQRRNLMASSLLQWEAMRRSKEQGMRSYDFWGVPEELAPHANDSGAQGFAHELPEAAEHGRGDLWGVYRFKRGFGGRLVAFSPAHDYVYAAPRYWLWEQLLPRALPLLRRVSARGAGGLFAS